MRADLTKESGGMKLGAGAYNGVITGARKFTANSGTPGIDITFSDTRKAASRPYWFTEDAIGQLGPLLTHAGIPEADRATFDSDTFNFNRLLNQPIAFSVLPNPKEPQFCDVVHVWQFGEEPPPYAQARINAALGKTANKPTPPPPPNETTTQGPPPTLDDKHLQDIPDEVPF